MRYLALNILKLLLPLDGVSRDMIVSWNVKYSSDTKWTKLELLVCMYYVYYNVRTNVYYETYLTIKMYLKLPMYLQNPNSEF